MLDLHYRYHWATEEKRLRPETEIKDLNPDVLMERRRGLEWLISEESDWFDISMDTQFFLLHYHFAKGDMIYLIADKYVIIPNIHNPEF